MIFTGYFEKIDYYKKHGLTPVCIAGYAPQDYQGAYYKKLAPKKSWWQKWHDQHLSEDWYETKYQETVLDLLDPYQVAEDMKSFGKNVVLLCYEKPNEFCHRHLVCRWLNRHRILTREANLMMSSHRDLSR